MQLEKHRNLKNTFYLDIFSINFSILKLLLKNLIMQIIALVFRIKPK